MRQTAQIRTTAWLRGWMRIYFPWRENLAISQRVFKNWTFTSLRAWTELVTCLHKALSWAKMEGRSVGFSSVKCWPLVDISWTVFWGVFLVWGFFVVVFKPPQSWCRDPEAKHSFESWTSLSLGFVRFEDKNPKHILHYLSTFSWELGLISSMLRFAAVIRDFIILWNENTKLFGFPKICKNFTPI